jgi:hypothetical protein
VKLGRKRRRKKENNKKIMPVGSARSDLLFTALEFYTLKVIKDIERGEDYVTFSAENSTGIMMSNGDEDWDIYMDGEKIGLIEKEVFDLCRTSENLLPLPDLYNRCKDVIKNVKVNETSSKFIINLFMNIGTYILTSNRLIGKPIKIGHLFICDIINKRTEFNLN